MNYHSQLQYPEPQWAEVLTASLWRDHCSLKSIIFDFFNKKIFSPTGTGFTAVAPFSLARLMDPANSLKLVVKFQFKLYTFLVSSSV